MRIARSRHLPFILLAALFTASSPYAAEIAGVRIEEAAKAGGTDLVLNGAGLRTRFFFKVYVAALYLPKKSTSASAIMEAHEPRRIVMHMLRDLDAETLIGSLKEGLRNNHGEAELAALKADTERFEALMHGIGNAKSGDVITLEFSPDGTAVGFNGSPRGSIAGENFGRALLRVWLGDKPADTALKQALLGS